VNEQNPGALLALGALGVTLLLSSGASAAPNSNSGGTISPARLAAEVPVSRDNAPVSLHLQDTPLRTALQTLFAGSGLQHAVEAAVPNYPITLELRDVPLSSALRTLLRLAPGVVSRKEGEVFIVGMRSPTVEPAQAYSEPAAPIDVAAVPDGEQWEKIPLNYLHPAIAAYVLNGRLVPNEVEIQTGFGGVGGYGNGVSSGLGSGFFGGPNGGGLGNLGNGAGLGYGNVNSYGQLPGGYPNGGFQSGINSVGQGIGNGLGSPIVGNGAVLVGPQPRRF